MEKKKLKICIKHLVFCKKKNIANNSPITVIAIRKDGSNPCQAVLRHRSGSAHTCSCPNGPVTRSEYNSVKTEIIDQNQPK